MTTGHRRYNYRSESPHALPVQRPAVLLLRAGWPFEHRKRLITSDYCMESHPLTVDFQNINNFCAQDQLGNLIEINKAFQLARKLLCTVTLWSPTMKTLFALTLGLAAVAVTPVRANTVTSDACQPGARDFSVTATTVVGCLAAGAGNINGNNDAFQQSNSRWVLVDASDTNGGTHDGWLAGSPSLVAGLSGGFTIDELIYETYARVAIGFKSGQGQADPDWAVFELASGTLSGSWSISGSQALSHAMLYGLGTPTVTVNVVPEPASLALFGLGLAGVVAARRRT